VSNTIEILSAAGRCCMGCPKTQGECTLAS
jgi:hypothetical protein